MVMADKTIAACQTVDDDDDDDDDEERREEIEETQEVQFKPPLYIQRYNIVSKIIQQHHENGIRIEKLLDVGCAECKFLKRSIQLPFLKCAYGLDIDKELLKQKVVSLKPLITDHLCKRQYDLMVKVFAGSIVDEHPVMKDIDVVTAIEVIEHLHEPVLQGFLHTVFSYIRPKLVIVTTPNSEYNVLFTNFSGFRHWDHKFEWTRAEFQHWCETVSVRYAYSVKYGGVGDPPADSSVGHCSQMAIFTLSSDVTLSSDGATTLNDSNKYEEMFSTVYPGVNMSHSELIDSEIQYILNCESFKYIQENDIADLSHTHIPLSLLLSTAYNLHEQLDIAALANRLQHLDYTLSSDRKYVVLDMNKPESSDDETYWNMDRSDNSDCTFEAEEASWD